MTAPYLNPDINDGRNFFFREFFVTDPVIPPFPFPSQQLTILTQLATFDTGNIAGIALLPSARAAGPNASITIVANNASANPLTITTAIPGDSFIVSAGFLLVIGADNIASTFKSNGADNWIGVSQTT